MKKYIKPIMECQIFEANEYIATCGSVTSYSFKCNAGIVKKYWHGYPYEEPTYGYLYDSNWNASLCTLTDYLGNTYQTNDYHACKETHTSDTTDNYLLGWFDPDEHKNSGNEIQVYIWQEVENGVVVNHHATEDIKSITSQINRS